MDRQGPPQRRFGPAAGDQLLGAVAGRSSFSTSLAAELTEALAGGQLALEFQTERRIAGALGRSGTIRSVEALVRWRHPSRGLVRPADFLPIAEESDLVERIGMWVLGEATARASVWQTSDPSLLGLSLSINMSAAELRRPHLVEHVLALLGEKAMAAESLTVEFQEDAVAADSRTAIDALRALREAQVRTSLDDCIAGPDLEQRLRRLPLDAIKIHPSMVAALGTAPGDASMRAMVVLARGLGLTTVAEGVETREQLARLRSLGCEFAQGYLYGKPLGASGISALLRAERRRRSDKSVTPSPG
ncbi:MAG: EAL domain-containing protein [Chloroflexi bacterium]|nr:EAL domain-containing protein [Chloroflexota bacterium]